MGINTAIEEYQCNYDDDDRTSENKIQWGDQQILFTE